ncbi:hypothetical protein COT52_01170 [candidate division WWE3 bacterium CG08_land_8_20_14_0_20_43_13]|uniref:Prepilin-type N-terminal cleavage/methylation domain-containing protein n=1 Tax=candidate division WWE3 bacterium CG08_land_8_20_14_0_20_43_13 TaxID=1975087 RepID=A0A2H0X7V2_UNCKA|nr:MAG: hypothetical protein COT52_01170 [candidate division WWE3 bacterium CG08_land_8_20_14_0_20_43_13]
MRRPNDSKGFTLVEFLLAMSMGVVLAVSVGGVVYNFAKNWAVSRDKDRLYRSGESVMQELVHQIHWADSVTISEEDSSLVLQIGDAAASYLVIDDPDLEDSAYLVKKVGDDTYQLTADSIAATSFIVKNRTNNILDEGDGISSYQISLTLHYASDPRLAYETSRIISLRQKQKAAL